MCFCDGYTDETKTSTTVFCLTPKLCREACDVMGTDCFGINIHDTLNQCLLSKRDSATAEVNEQWTFFDKLSGTACTQVHDFSQMIGMFAVTKRVHVLVDYIFTPEQESSIELTAPADESFTYNASNGLLSKDRISIIDCKGTCGLSLPSSNVLLPGSSGDVSMMDTWASFWPWSFFQDMPHNDTENRPMTDNVATPASPVFAFRYTLHEDKYCRKNNIDLDSKMVPLDGVMQKLKQHQCFNKCALNAPCEGSDCFCEGHYSGYDDETSNAICGDLNLCKYLCDNIEDCKSIDMHSNNNRCFLNSACGLHQDQHDTIDSEQYSLHVKFDDKADDSAQSRRLKQQRSLLASVDAGSSWSRMLRFKPIQINSGGTFKVCFCDSTLLGKGQTCSRKEHFNVEVGKIHASGVSCLLSETKLQRVDCVTQHHAGLRCYETYDAPMRDAVAPYFEETDYSRQFESDQDKLDTWCMLGPEEQTRNDNRCQTSAGFVSTEFVR